MDPTGSTETPVSAPAPAPASPSPPPESSPAPGPSGAPAGTAAVSAPASLPSWRDHFQSHGLDLSGYKDDAAAAGYVAQALAQGRQAQEMARYGQEVAPHYAEFQEWRAQQARAAAARQEAEKPWYDKWWQPPAYDPSWDRLLSQDANGNLTAAPGAPADLVQRYQNYRHFRQQQAERLMANPYTFFEEPIKHLAAQEAERIVGQHLGGYKDTNFAQTFVQQNTSWLHQHDAQGNPVRDLMGGGPVLSSWGQKFAGYVREAQDRHGIQAVEGQQEYALMKVQLDRALELLAQQQPAAAALPPANPRAAANEQVLQEAKGRQRGGRAPLPNNGAAPQVHLSLPERIRQNLKAAGINEIT